MWVNFCHCQLSRPGLSIYCEWHDIHWSSGMTVVWHTLVQCSVMSHWSRVSLSLVHWNVTFQSVTFHFSMSGILPSNYLKKHSKQQHIVANVMDCILAIMHLVTHYLINNFVCERLIMLLKSVNRNCLHEII